MGGVREERIYQMRGARSLKRRAAARASAAISELGFGFGKCAAARWNSYLPPVSGPFRPAPRTPTHPDAYGPGPCWLANFISHFSFSVFILFSIFLLFLFLFLFYFFIFYSEFVFLFKFKNHLYFEFCS
jgi:hypothetical protein